MKAPAHQDEADEVLAPELKGLISGCPPVLRSERAADFDALLAELAREIKPRGIVEKMYVRDFACLIWEILRLRRCKVGIINIAYPSALRRLIESMNGVADTIMDADLLQEMQAKKLAFDWFDTEAAKEEVRALLDKFGLDESAIEAEAIRQSFSDLEKIERVLMGLETRRDRALARIADYRFSFAEHLRQTADQIIGADADDVGGGADVLQLTDHSLKTSPE